MYIWITLIFVLVLDRVSKVFIQDNFRLGESIQVIPGFFHLTYIVNSGAAFGILEGGRWFFVVSAVVVFAMILYFQSKISKDQRLMRVCMGLIGGGALGNLYDRLFLGGKVVDFLEFKIWSYIFNIADSMIVIGSIILIFLLFRLKDKPSE